MFVGLLPYKQLYYTRTWVENRAVGPHTLAFVKQTGAWMKRLWYHKESMACLVLNVVLALSLMVYLSGGNVVQLKGHYKSQGNFKGSLFMTTTSRRQLACLSTCLRHHPRCWGAMYSEEFAECQLLEYPLNQPSTTFLSSGSWKIFGRVI